MANAHGQSHRAHVDFYLFGAIQTPLRIQSPLIAWLVTPLLWKKRRVIKYQKSASQPFFFVVTQRFSLKTAAENPLVGRSVAWRHSENGCEANSNKVFLLNFKKVSSPADLSMSWLWHFFARERTVNVTLLIWPFLRYYSSFHIFAIRSFFSLHRPFFTQCVPRSS